jgi:RimJ/RimL family protein N-acetyltransferase
MIIDKNLILIRKACEDDAKLLFEWVNEPNVRKSSVNSDPIEWNGHLQWFRQKLDSELSYIYILEERISLGQIRFDPRTESNGYDIDFSIDKEFRGQSLGSLIIEKGIQEIRKVKREHISLYATVKKENIPSLKAFLNNEFVIQNEDSNFIHLKYQI